MTAPCFICGSTDAPYGYGWPGVRSFLPPEKRGKLWSCADHRDAAEARRNKAMEITHAEPTNEPAPVQGALDL